MPLVTRAGLACVVALATACSAASTTGVGNYKGTYQLWLVGGSNGCALAGVAEGQSTSKIPLVVTQDSVVPQNMTATLGGSAGMLMSTLVGTNLLTGTLGGSQVTLTPGPLDGGMPPSGSKGNCTFTTSVVISLNFAGDTVQGTIVYGDNTNSGSDCGSLRSCQTVIAVAGVLTPGDS
jgi:hypothetical protein